MRELFKVLISKKRTVVTAESLTGGLISSKIVNTPGASKVYWGGFVTYSIDSKKSILEVPESIIDEFGVVSLEVARSMSVGALSRSGADYALSITGLAGPKSSEDREPVGTVFVCLSSRHADCKTFKLSFSGSRETIREDAANRSLDLLLKYIIEC